MAICSSLRVAVSADADALEQLPIAYTHSVTVLKNMAEGSSIHRWWVAPSALQCLGEWLGWRACSQAKVPTDALAPWLHAALSA